ncbi:protealysin inhibitor emfourin [Micromonospora mangrovi]|uniref:Protealysin inhibitor emfourin n=2 Tax=Micromonospora TaxID=1873 RepID=A0AAU7M5D3_9ACTN
MSAMLRVIGRAMTAFALLIGVGAGTLAVAGPAQAAYRTASAVTVVRTGGFAGLTQDFTVLSSTVHTSTPDLMYTVNGREFRSLAPSYLPSSNGADRYVYTVTVSYTNGATKTVTTMDGADAPAVLWQVIDTTVQITNDLTATTAG